MALDSAEHNSVWEGYIPDITIVLPKISPHVTDITIIIKNIMIPGDITKNKQRNILLPMEKA